MDNPPGTAGFGGKRASAQGPRRRPDRTTHERLAERSRDSSFAMAKRASGASEHGRVLVVQGDSATTGNPHTRLAAESSGHARLSGTSWQRAGYWLP
jgi:hypothetical protein